MTVPVATLYARITKSGGAGTPPGFSPSPLVQGAVMAAIRINDPLTAEQLRAILEYDPETGIFVWRHRADCPKHWNTRYADKPAGTVVGAYRIIIIKKRKYVASRLAWLWFYGKWPNDFVDHANGNKQDDRISNLRAATKSQNSANTSAPTHNTSGLKGVSWSKKIRLLAGSNSAQKQTPFSRLFCHSRRSSRRLPRSRLTTFRTVREV